MLNTAPRFFVLTTLAVMFSLSSTVIVRAQGIAVTGVGPVNRSMGGAGTAAPLDAIGALHWNPASISALECSEMSFGAELLLADVDLSSTIGATTGTTSGEAGVAIVPSVGWTHHIEGTPLTVGLGVYGIGGFRNNMPPDLTNPLIAAVGGRIFADAELLQIAPTLSYRVTDRLSIGISPTITTGKITFDPLGPSVITPFPSAGSGNRVHWGGGVQLGVYYIGQRHFHWGVSVKSRQWMEDFRFFSPAVPGGVAKFDLDYPMIVSLGMAYSGFDRWVLAADARYFDYQNTPGFKELGYSNVFAAAFGAQYQATDRLKLRLGYNFNQNPLQSADAFTNFSAPLIQDQNVAAGASYRFARNVDLTAAYVYLVNNGLTGPLPAALFGPGASLTNEINAHSLLMGVTVRY